VQSTKFEENFIYLIMGILCMRDFLMFWCVDVRIFWCADWWMCGCADCV